jgi:hypothetical protein
MNDITRESVRQRLMELHPGIDSAVNVTAWSHGGVSVQLSVHPRELVGKGCWTVYAVMRSDPTVPVETQERKALALALQLAEAGEWNKPPVPDQLAAVLAG